MNVEGGIALVTGGGRGLGRAIAEAFAESGTHVVVVDVDTELLAWTDDREEFTAVNADIAVTDDVGRLVGEIQNKFGQLNYLVNNAGILQVAESASLDEANWSRTFDVNIGGTIRLSTLCHGLLAAGEGQSSIVNISSITAAMGFPGRLAYAASKAAIESLSRTLAAEWGPDGIRVNAVAPGFFLTERAAQVHAAGEADSAARSMRTPLRRPGDPRELAETVVWVAKEASYVTGQVVTVDGGFVMNADYAVQLG